MKHNSKNKAGVWNRLRHSVHRRSSSGVSGAEAARQDSYESSAPPEVPPLPTSTASDALLDQEEATSQQPRLTVPDLGPESPQTSQSIVVERADPATGPRSRASAPDSQNLDDQPRATQFDLTQHQSETTSENLALEPVHAEYPTTAGTFSLPRESRSPPAMHRAQQGAAPPTMKGQANGGHATNGYFSPPGSPSVRYGGSNRGSVRVSGFTSSSHFGYGRGSEKTAIVRDTAIALKRKSASELGAGISDTADRVTFIDFVEWIRAERLSTLPHKGSRWDTVLIRALYFAERLHGFESALKGHALDNEPAAQLGYGHIRLLLELGHENAVALDKAFSFLYRSSSSVTALLARSQVLQFSSEIYEQLCTMYGDLLTLVIEVAIRFYKAVHSTSEGSVSLDMYQVFGDSITTFRERQDTVTKAIWRDQIASGDTDAEDAVEVNALARWLAPQDRVLATVAQDHTLIAGELAEFTCVWFLDDLTRFVKGGDHTLVINGGPGAGKTTLAGSLAERLQRPIARKSYATLFCSVGAIPSQANTLNVVKALLHQLLNIRVGNMHLYHAVANAYLQSKYEADPAKYEELLWNALEDALRNPLVNGLDTILIVEGLDELADGQSAAQGLLQRLVKAVAQGKGVQLLAVGQTLSLPTGAKGTTYSISLDDTRDDVHEVVLRVLVKSQHFRSKTGREQEAIISRVIETSSGSFLQASLTSELLRLEKSAENFSKAATNIQKVPIEELVHKIITALDLTEDSKQLLSWIVQSARPLTYHEIESLFSLNVQTGTRSERRVNVHELTGVLAPLLSVQEDIVRPRHALVHASVKNLFKNGKVTTAIKDQPLDLLFRLLTYAKLALPEKSEPTLDDNDRSPLQHCFDRHHFLEYVVRYWTWHLEQTSIVTPGKPDLKVPSEMQRIFPESTVMPILEWLCWDDQFPGAQEIQHHDLVGRLRSKLLTEQHPAVLQSYINTATYYEMMRDVTRASRLYYIISTTGQKILSASHPVVVECANRFLILTHTEVTTTRTEIMTRREQILILLISAYERQFGMTADIVVQTRELLAELYLHISEHEKANEVLGITEDTSGGNRGGDIDTGRGLDGRSWIEVKKRREHNKSAGLDSVFAERDDEEESRTIVDLSHVETLRKQIEHFTAQKDFISAELAYVELWQRLSESCRTTLSTDWHQKKIETIQAYANFLATQERRTEAISVTTSLWREYEHHELSFSEMVVSKLTESARFLKNFGEYNASLSIFKHASSYYKNVRKEDSRSLSSIEEEMIVISNEALKKESTKERTATQSTQWDMFNVLITNRSKKIDSMAIELSKQLTAQYMAQKSWSKAISVIHSTLERTWSLFLAKSVHEVTMTSEFQKESIELVEQLAQCYIQQRSFEKADDVYVRLFRAALSNPKDQATLERVKAIIIGFYVKRGYPDKVISVYQELLAVYRRVVGPSHETTISVLYELATRCRAHARSHPYWIEYYQQIVTTLNKDSKTCHARAMEAAIIVAESYWEERRYSDAVSAYGVIWSTFVHKTKDFKSFSDAAFVRNLYERYYQCLEETKAEWEILRAVSSEYRDISKAVFGANSSIAIEATVALATVLSHSEKHSQDAISLYEEASSNLSQSKSTSDISIDASELRRSLTTLYRRKIIQSDSKSVSQETVQRATSMYNEQFAETRKSYGYSHETTLNSLRELSMLYVRQQKSEAAVKELNTAVTEIATKETSSQKMYESAMSIVQTFQAAGLTQQCTQLIEDLHYQLVAKEKSSRSVISVTEATSASLFFLAVLEYQTRKDLSITLSEIMSSIKAQTILYAHFKQLVTTKASLDKVLVSAAPLRYQLKYWNRLALLQIVDDQAVKIFVEREAANVQLLSKDNSARYFIVGILDYIGNRKNVDFVRSVIISANITLKRLIDNNQFKEAHDVAKMAFKYAQYRKAYKGPHAIARGFTLASYLDGRGENRCPEPELRKQLLKLSNEIIKDILKICHEEKINLAAVQVSELNELIALLGEQKDYDTLETLLNELWSTREAQRNWPPEILLTLGRRLICARFLAGHQIKALRLCEDVAYNMRRVHGIKNPATIETYDLLAQLHTRTAQYYQNEAATDKASASSAADHFKKAVLVHEDVLRWILHDATGGEYGEDEDDDTAASILAEHGIKTDDANVVGSLDGPKRTELVKRHMHLLKLAYQRLGGWPKSYADYETLNANLFNTFGDSLKGTEGVEKWQSKGYGGGKAESNEGVFSGNTNWEILV